MKIKNSKLKNIILEELEGSINQEYAKKFAAILVKNVSMENLVYQFVKRRLSAMPEGQRTDVREVTREILRLYGTGITKGEE